MKFSGSGNKRPWLFGGAGMLLVSVVLVLSAFGVPEAQGCGGPSDEQAGNGMSGAAFDVRAAISKSPASAAPASPEANDSAAIEQELPRADALTQSTATTGPHRWKLTMADDFKGPGSAFGAAAGNECYSGAPICTDPTWGGVVPCSDSNASYPGLSALNKCIWAVGRGNNFMTSTGRFDPAYVTVDPNLDNGVAIIGGDPTGTDNSACGKDAGAHTVNGQVVHDVSKLKCLFKTGWLSSSELAGKPGPTGFSQGWGRFEFRAKLPAGPASWPGLWMLGEGAWPESGELDMVDGPDNNTPRTLVNQGIAMGTCYHPSTGAITWDDQTCWGADKIPYQFGLTSFVDILGIWIGTTHGGDTGAQMKSTKLPISKPSFADSYHTFAAEVEAGYVAFSVDGVVTKMIPSGTVLHASDMNDHHQSHQFPMMMPPDPFYFIISHEIQATSLPKGFTTQRMYVDYVKAWSQCDDPKDPACSFCIAGGREWGPNCQIEALSTPATLITDSSRPALFPGVAYTVDATPAWPGIYYQQVNGLCPYGGTAAGPNCELLALSQPNWKNGNQPVIYQGVHYWVDSTPAFPGVYYQQTNGTCPHGGTIAGPNCELLGLAAPSYSHPVLLPTVHYWADTDPRWAGVFYAQEKGQCPYGGWISGPSCQIYSAPAGTLQTNIRYSVDNNPAWPGVYYTP